MKLTIEHITRDSCFWDKINALAREAFPPEEYMESARLVEMEEGEDFDFLAMKDGEMFVGFMAVMLYEELAYLFFLAIDSSCRSKGYGSCAIKALKGEYPDKKHVVDFEMLDASADNRLQREKRRVFYLRNGYRETGFFLSYLGVNYEVFCMDEEFEPDVFKAMMGTIQVEGFQPRYFSSEDRI